MLAAMPKRRIVQERKRRSHAKSRNGCGNCRLRRVKCDEARPHCRKCKAYGVSCDYGSSEALLELPTQGSFQVDLSPKPSCTDRIVDFGVAEANNDNPIESEVTLEMDQAAFQCGFDQSTAVLRYCNDNITTPLSLISMNASIAAMIDHSLCAGTPSSNAQTNSKGDVGSWSPSWHFSESHLEIMERFQSRTALTIGDKHMAPAYRHIICQLAFKHTFLMHMLLGLTLMHDADLVRGHSLTQAAQLKHASLQHWSVATKLFNRILAQPILPSDRDAIWATSVHLGAASLWYIESSNVEEVWPLKSGEADDLSWMKLGEGKKLLWRLTEPTRMDSVFHEVIKHRPCVTSLDWVTNNDTSRIPERVRRGFNITPWSTPANNPYHLPLVILSHLQDMHLTHDNAMNFLSVTAFSTPVFQALLQVKDAGAIFVLGWWYKLVQDGDLWWVTNRAKTEGEAVRLWLRRADGELADLFDEVVCGGARDTN